MHEKSKSQHNINKAENQVNGRGKQINWADQLIFIAVRQLFVYNKNVMDFCASPPDGLAQDRCSVGMTSASAMDGNPKRRLKKCVCLKLRRRQSAKERKFLWQKPKTET